MNRLHRIFTTLIKAAKKQNQNNNKNKTTQNRRNIIKTESRTFAKEDICKVPTP